TPVGDGESLELLSEVPQPVRSAAHIVNVRNVRVFFFIWFYLVSLEIFSYLPGTDGSYMGTDRGPMVFIPLQSPDAGHPMSSEKEMEELPVISGTVSAALNDVAVQTALPLFS